ncbi:MAG TPA: hypothetical protein VFZ53_33490 [Polyangiaceae bacterium]
MIPSSPPPASPDAAASPSERFRLPERMRVLAPGLYAWLLTVVHPAAQPGVPFAARAFAFLAAVSLVAGVALESDRPRLGRALGIYGFIGAALGAWCFAGPALGVDSLDPVRSALGVLGWVLYAFGWGRARGSQVPEDSPNVLGGAPLSPRAHLSPASLPVVGVAVVAALVLEGLAFRVERAEPALFAHGVATACALLVLGSGSRIALGLGGRRELPSAGARMNAMAPPLAALAVLLGLGLVWAAFAR